MIFALLTWYAWHKDEWEIGTLFGFLALCELGIYAVTLLTLAGY